jgi:hypothetical protein
VIIVSNLALVVLFSPGDLRIIFLVSVDLVSGNVSNVTLPTGYKPAYQSTLSFTHHLSDLLIDTHVSNLYHHQRVWARRP